MKTGGTKAPVKRKTSGFKIGDRVKCLFAATSWYEVGKEYDVVGHPETLLPSVVGSDGLYDEMVLILSKFEKVVKNEYK